MSHSENQQVDILMSLSRRILDGSMSRREALGRAAALGLSTPAMMAIASVSAGAQSPAASPAAAASTPDPNAKTGGTLRVGLQADPAELDPHKTQLTAAWHVIEHVYNGLVRPNEKLEPVGALAESWEISEDGATYTFHLRKGVKFHNGREMKADDVKYSFERILDPKLASPNAPDLASIKSIEVVDDSTVKITLKAADSSFLAKMMGSSQVVVPKEEVEKNGDLMQTMVGTGPFKFVEYTPNSVVKLERNPDYWEEGRPYLDALEMQIIPDNTSRTTALTSGTVDFIEYAPAMDLDTFKSDSSLTMAGDQNTNIRFIAINVTKDPLSKPEVRQAIEKCIDRQAIVDAAVFGAGTPTNILFPDTYWAGYKSEIPAQDIDGAKALLKQAGLENGFKTSILSWSQYKFLSDAAIVLQEQLKAIGIEAEMVLEENATFLADYFANKFDLSVTGTSAYADPNDVVESNFQSASTNNASRYNSAEMDDLIKQGVSEKDQAKRAEIYKQVQELLKKDLPWIPMFIAQQYEVMKSYVKGYQHIATGTNITLKDTWLDQ